jgi:hypothetical protein
MGDVIFRDAKLRRFGVRTAKFFAGTYIVPNLELKITSRGEGWRSVTDWER